MKKNIIYSFVGLGFAVVAFTFAIVEVVRLKKNINLLYFRSFLVLFLL